MPAAHSPTGEGESPLWLYANSRRADKPRPRRLGDFDQESAAERRRSDFPATIAHELARVSQSPGFGDRGHRLLHGGHLEPQTALRPFLYRARNSAHLVVRCDREPEPGLGQPENAKPDPGAPGAGFSSQVPICDNDKKFPFAFEHVLAGEGVRVIRTPLQAP